MERFFNTAGPVNCEDHYCLPPLGRFNVEEIVSLIAQKKYREKSGLPTVCIRR